VSQWGNDPSVQHILVFSAIPFFINPESSAHLVYWMEKEKLSSHPTFIPEVNKVLEHLLPYKRKVHIIGGDIHAYLNTSLCLVPDPEQDQERFGPPDESGLRCLWQTSTSGITEGSAVINSLKLVAFTLSWVHFTTNRIGRWAYVHWNAFLGRNFVVVAIQDEHRRIVPVFESLSFLQQLLHLAFDRARFLVSFLITFTVVSLFSLVLQWLMGDGRPKEVEDRTRGVESKKKR